MPSLPTVQMAVCPATTPARPPVFLAVLMLVVPYCVYLFHFSLTRHNSEFRKAPRAFASAARRLSVFPCFAVRGTLPRPLHSWRERRRGDTTPGRLRPGPVPRR